jgi:hypothetical protein
MSEAVRESEEALQRRALEARTESVFAQLRQHPNFTRLIQVFFSNQL